MDLNKERHLKNFISVYLLNYDETIKTKSIRKLLEAEFERRTEEYSSSRLKKLSQMKENLFSEKCMENMAKMYVNKLNVEVTSLSHQIYFLDIISREANIYDSIIPEIAEVIILRVESNQNISEKNRLKKKSMEIINHKLGDPRFGNMIRRWANVKNQSREIYIRWLIEEDLNIFWQIIEKAAVDRMWKYRKKFWQSYLLYIKSTWCF